MFTPVFTHISFNLPFLVSVSPISLYWTETPYQKASTILPQKNKFTIKQSIIRATSGQENVILHIWYPCICDQLQGCVLGIRPEYKIYCFNPIPIVTGKRFQHTEEDNVKYQLETITNTSNMTKFANAAKQTITK